MSCKHIDSLGLRPPRPDQAVYREDCTQCFDSIDNSNGLDVCLSCFNGGCTAERQHSQKHFDQTKHPLVLNIRRIRKTIVRDEPPQKMSKLAIAAETEAERYDTKTSVRCLDCELADVSTESSILAGVVEGILRANAFARQEEVKAWEQEMTSCEHILMLQQEAKRAIESQQLGHCSMCDLNENLWLCLQCGNLGCGRAQFGGVGGHSHGLAHSDASQHPVAVKLGSITPDGTADVYCYQCDEERVDESLDEHLAHWGIMLAERRKTEKSLTEMQIEQNLRWEFSMTTDDGEEMKPLFGKGLTGMKNIGNSCYLASIVQCLFSLPQFQTRYFDVGDVSPAAAKPAQDLETQLRKMADGLLSGRYSHPDSDVVASENSSEIPHQRGIAPAMLKHLIGRGHPEFSTMRQQDAFEFLLHINKIISRSQHSPPLQDPTKSFQFVMEQKLQCLNCKRVKYSTHQQDNISIPVPVRELPQETAESPVEYEAVTLKECFDIFTAEEKVELECTACCSKDGFSKRSLFKTFPDVMAVNAQRFALVNWVPTKVDVPVIVGDETFQLDKFLSPGQQPDEELLVDDAAVESFKFSFTPDQEAMSSLQQMGFPQNRCERALHATGNNDANAAMEWLFAHMEDADIDKPLVIEADAPSTSSIDPEKVENLGNMGFAPEQARKALRETGGDMERAVDWLFNHPGDQGDDQGDKGSTPAKMSLQENPGSSQLPATFELQSIVCHKGTSIHTGHYVAFVRKQLGNDNAKSWVLFNDEKVVKAEAMDAMKKFAYVYFFQRSLPGRASEMAYKSSQSMAAPNEALGTLFGKAARSHLRGGAEEAAAPNVSSKLDGNAGMMDQKRRIMSMSSVFRTVPVSYVVQTSDDTGDSHPTNESTIASLIKDMIQRSELPGELKTDSNGQLILCFDKSQADEDELMANQIQAAASRVSQLMEDVKLMDRSMATEKEYVKWVQRQSKGAAQLHHSLEDASWPVGPDDEDLMAN